MGGWPNNYRAWKHFRILRAIQFYMTLSVSNTYRFSSQIWTHNHEFLLYCSIHIWMVNPAPPVFEACAFQSKHISAIKFKPLRALCPVRLRERFLGHRQVSANRCSEAFGFESSKCLKMGCTIFQLL